GVPAGRARARSAGGDSQRRGREVRSRGGQQAAAAGGAVSRGHHGAADDGRGGRRHRSAGGTAGPPRGAGAVEPFGPARQRPAPAPRSEEHTSELQSRENLVCRLLLEKKNMTKLAQNETQLTVRTQIAQS